MDHAQIQQNFGIRIRLAGSYSVGNNWLVVVRTQSLHYYR